MTYRPTVRYADVFRDYINSLFHATTLDRNQLIRAALFSAALSDEFQELLTRYKTKDVSLPSPLWCFDQHEIWLEQCPKTAGGGKDVNANNKQKGEVEKDSGVVKRSEDETKTKEIQNRRNEPIERQERQIPFQPRILNKGGIIIRFG